MITMKDIAVRAGVSRSTVSLVLNDKHLEQGISEETCQRIRAVALEMGYRRNSLARAVVTGKNPLFVFLIPVAGLESEVITRILMGVMIEAESCQHTVQIIRIPVENMHEAIEQCVELRPTGVLTVYPEREIIGLLHQEMERYQIPVVVLDCSFPLPYGTKVLSDDIDGVCQAMAHLRDLGHRRIAYIGGYDDHGVSLVRGEGYRDAMAIAGIPVPEGYFHYGNWEPERVAKITRAMFDGVAAGSRPTAVLCADDKTAMVAVRTLYQLKIRVPEEVSLVGFADLAMAAFCSPALTTVAQPFREMGKIAIRILVDPFASKEMPNESDAYLVPTHLVVRESTAPVAENT